MTDFSAQGNISLRDMLFCLLLLDFLFLLSIFPFLYIFNRNDRLSVLQANFFNKLVLWGIFLILVLIVFSFFHFLCDFRETVPLLTVKVLLKLSPILLKPLYNLLDDAVGADPTLPGKILRTDIDESLPIHIFQLNCIDSKLQSKEGAVSMEWRVNQSSTSLGVHYVTFLGSWRHSYSGDSIAI